MNNQDGSCLICKMGTPSLVTNSCVSGIINASKNNKFITNIFITENGLDGLLNNRVFNISDEDDEELEYLKTTPGFSFIGRDITNDATEIQFDGILTCLKKNKVKYMIFIGDSEYFEKYLQLIDFLKKQNYDIKSIYIPDSFENNMLFTDHCIGYGSAAKAVMLAVHEFCNKLYVDSCIHFLKIKENGAGWLTAASSIANLDGNGPDAICFDRELLIDDSTIKNITRIYENKKSCIVAIPSTILKEDIELASKKLPYCRIIVHEIYPLELQYTSFVSLTDCDESFMSGKAALENVINTSNNVLGLARGHKEGHYASKTRLIKSSFELSKVRCFPTSWIKENKVTQEFLDYILPLMQGDVIVNKENMLPRYARLKKNVIT